MTSWHKFAQQAPELAAFGNGRFQSGVAYLGTIRADGSPLVASVLSFQADLIRSVLFGSRR